MQQLNQSIYFQMINKLTIMKPETKNRLMIWAIIFLSVLNLTTLGTILYHEYYSGINNINSGNVPERIEGDAEKFSGGYFRDQLNFSEEQMDKFRGFNPRFRRDAREITYNLANLRKEMLLEMSRENPDSTHVVQIADSIGILHRNLKLITFDYYENIKLISDSSQRTKLEQLFKEFFVNDITVGFNGSGRSGDQRNNGGRGRRQNNY